MRTELKEIDPPRDVQDTMNKVVKAENEKIAAIDYATAAETVADGVKRAKIKEAEGYKRAQILHAEGEAEAIMLVNEAADKYFTGNAQLLKKLETVEASLKSNAKIVIPTGTELVKLLVRWPAYCLYIYIMVEMKKTRMYYFPKLNRKAVCK